MNECDALGSDFVIDEAALLEQAEKATFRTQQKIPLILRPQNREHVSEMMRIAARHRVPIYPVSSGKNWGYGSRVPVVSGCVLADLSAMNRIVDFNEKLGYVTVQPGVTQEDLFNFLRGQKSKLWMDADWIQPAVQPDRQRHGAAALATLRTAIISAQVCGLEVVLANGDVIRTGFAGLPGARAGQVYRWGAGPSLDGLFSQSNFGIVTEMTIWLMPEPECFQAFFFHSIARTGWPGLLRPCVRCVSMAHCAALFTSPTTTRCWPDCNSSRPGRHRR